MTARAIRDHGYRLVAMAKGEIKVHFIVPPGSPSKTFATSRDASS